MARRDVDLVIKAKDQAASVVDSITKALNNFVEAQKNLDAKADKTEGTLTNLGAAFGKLDKALRNVGGADRLTQKLDQAAQSLQRLEDQYRDTAEQNTRLDRQLKQSRATLESYTGKLERNLSVQERQKAVIAKAKTDQKELTRAYEQAASAQEKLQRRQQQLPALIDKAAIAANKAARNFDNLSAQVLGTEQPTAALVERLANAERRMVDTGSRLTKLRTEFGDIGSKINTAGSALTLFADQASRAGSNLNKQERILDRMAQSYNDIKAATTAVGQRQGRLNSELARSTSSLSRLDKELTDARTGLDRMSASTDKATQDLNDLAKRGFLVLVGAARDQKRVMLETSQAYDQARTKATQLGQALARTTAPTREMVQEFTKAAAESTRLKTQLQEQRTALQGMTQTLQQSGRGYEDLRASQALFLEIIDRQVAEMNRADAAASRSSASVHALATANTVAAGGARKLASESERLASANTRAAGATQGLAGAYRQFYGDTRRSLGLLQRIRGEVLSLVAAYGGLYGAISAIRETINATQTLEAAQARLNVAFNNDSARVAQEFDFLRRTSDRLGISLGELATEYSKFNIATQNTSLEGDRARRIFVQVAEAARVNRSSTKELSGVFVALTQIVSKGAVQMEELRQQLGDRLPGAIKIMADGLGVTTAELIKMMEQGEITEEALVSFADELQRRFGSGLPDALLGITVALGRLQNAAFQAAAEFGEGGFIAALQRFANTLTEVLRSADFEAFIRRVSKALGALVDGIGFLAENFQITITALVGLLAFKLSPILIALVDIFGKVTGATTTTGTSFVALRARAAAMGVTVTRTQFAVRNLTRSMKALTASTGIGLAFVTISTAISLWATNADEATEALNEHRKIIDEVKNAYDRVDGSVQAWRDSLEGVTTQELINNIRRLEEAADAARDALSFGAQGNDSFLTNFFGFNLSSGTEIFDVSRRAKRAVQDVVDAYEAGDISANNFKNALSDAMQEVDDGSQEFRQYSEFVLNAADAVLELEASQAEAEQALVAMTGAAEEAQGALDALNGVMDTETADRMTEAVSNLGDAMERLEGLLPEAKDEMGDVAEAARDMAAAYQEALTAARSLPDAIQRIAAEQAIANDFAGRFADLNSRALDFAVDNSLVDRIIGVESGGNPTARNPNSTATGLGQFIESTWLQLFRDNFPDRAAGMTDAMILALREDAALSREMVQLYIRDNAQILQRMGVALTDANLYLAHFLGPGGAAALINSAPGTRANAVLGADQISANRSILDGKTREEVIAWAQRKVGLSEQELTVLEDQADAIRDGANATRDTIANNEFEISQQQRILDGKEREAAIEAAVRDARADNPAITEEEIARIREQTGALFDLELAQERAGDAETEAAQRARAASERVNALLQQRKALYASLEAAQSEGDTEKATQLEERIGAVNEQLQEAIANARAMWEAVGGEQAANAIIRLDTAALRAENLSQQAEKVYLDWSRVSDLFVTGLSGAFDSFAQAVANGENAFDAARDAFLQFASDFLLEIARMIVQQAIFNALQGVFGGTPFGSLIGLGHTGGLVGSNRIGSGNSSRSVNPAIFSAAMRYHSGGIAGLRPGEVPAILEKGEEVLTRDDPRHMFNGGGASRGSGSPDMSIVNTFDAEGFMEAGLASLRGKGVFLNFVKANKRELKAVLE